MMYPISFLLIIYILISNNIIKCYCSTKNAPVTSISVFLPKVDGTRISSSEGLADQSQATATAVSHVNTKEGKWKKILKRGESLQTGQQNSSIVGAPNGPAQQPIMVRLSNEHGNSGSNDVPAERVSSDISNVVQVKSALLKEHKGIKITGPCTAKFYVFLIPFLEIYVDAENNEIEMNPIFIKITEKILFEKEKSNLHNKCAHNKTFKVVVYIEENILTLKWKVYPSTTETDKMVDVRKYRMKDIGRPITSIQVITSSNPEKQILIESKNYSISNMPEKCDAIASDCFFGGIIEIEKCYQCALFLESKEKASECLNYVSADMRQRFDEIKTEGQDDENYNEIQLTEAIDSILMGIKDNNKNNKKDLAIPQDLDSTLKRQITNYCNLLKGLDMTRMLENYELGNEMEVLNNLNRMLKMHKGEKYISLKNKLKNAAICMKNVSNWGENRTGLVLPDLPYNKLEGKNVMHFNYDVELKDYKNVGNSIYKEDDDGVVDLTKYEEADMNTARFTDRMYCNEDYCDRWKDKNSCVSKIEAEDQGNCATSWLFASKLHLETIRCMKGYDHASGSALYVANCSKIEPDERCKVGSNPLEFLRIIDEKKILPLESNLPYSYKNVANDCPNPKYHWTNLWTDTKLMDYKYEPNSLGAKGYTAYESYKFRGNMDTFIKKIKHEVMHKGSMIAYVKAEKIMSYDFNGKKVYSLCGEKMPDHAVNIIGWGNYISDKGMKKSYWIMRNSWGKYWGDEGNFKVDIYGPEKCEHNFIHSAVMFNIDMPLAKVNTKKEAELYNYYLKISPDFYSNLYYKNFSSDKTYYSNSRKGLYWNSMIHGQTDEPSFPSTVERQGIPGGAVMSPGRTQLLVTSVSVGREGTEKSTHEVRPTGGYAPILEGEHPRSESPRSVTDARVPPSSPVSSYNFLYSQVDEKTKILHILKHVKDGKLKIGLAKYDILKSASGDHVCSRSYAYDPGKQEECFQFCERHWNECRGSYSPGYCLSKKRKKNDCYFCYV
ncbi:serine-repeat antigen, putative [Plasmodium malariae]|uniref:Serine-repeat antigen, putative n=1 Tax=Plasmodium malariae TaxID=5858 RepID=A0A1D3JJ86_PLAMA|nr:serine-repeat antigen, putative [Plasmodium malariae]SBT86549.1 serine-repeat antigen, putative [Plasmodium malariae]